MFKLKLKKRVGTNIYLNRRAKKKHPNISLPSSNCLLNLKVHNTFFFLNSDIGVRADYQVEI